MDAPFDYEYVALSYVWDEQKILTMSEDRLGDWEAKPRTVEDSISVVKEPGYRYLGVDKYVSYLVTPSNIVVLNTSVY